MVRHLRLLVVNNQEAGRKTLQKHLNTLIGRLVLEGIVSSVDRPAPEAASRRQALRRALEEKPFDLVMVLGGDGTVHEVVNGMMESQVRIPILLIPAGTINDFANYLYLPRDMDSVFEMIKAFRRQKVDVGKVNSRYFINVAFAGMLSRIGYTTSGDIKTVFGRLAYYAEGIRQAREEIGSPHVFQFEHDGELLQTRAYLFAVLNSSSTGGFMNFAPYAEVNDGLLDVIVIKHSDIVDMAAVFFKLIAGQHLKDPNVLYFKTDRLTVRTESEGLVVDTDGEEGVRFPLEFSIVPGALEFLVP